jgi:nucleoid-associated protein YgaU
MGKIFCILFSITCLFMSSCTSVPSVTSREALYRQIREAEAVLQQAQNLEAPVYAPERYLEAQLIIRKAKKMMNAEKYRDAGSLALEAKQIGEQAKEESQEERKRYKALAERLLSRAGDIWDRYEEGDEKKYAPEIIAEIKKFLDEGYGCLDNGRYKDALDAAQRSHQRLASLPEAVEKGREALLEEKKRVISRQSAEDIIKAAQHEASKIIEDARKKAQKILLEAQVSAAKDRLEEFERIYPSTFTVKKGGTLIDIARRREMFNDQFMWPLIYKANRDQMRDPKIVFPGQVLSIPRDLTFEEIIEARKQAEAPPPYIPPNFAYNPEFYRRYLLIQPEKEDAAEDKESKKPGQRDEER